MLWPISCGNSSGHAAELVSKLNYKFSSNNSRRQRNRSPIPVVLRTPTFPPVVLAHRCTSCQQVERVVVALTTVNSSNCVYVVCVH